MKSFAALSLATVALGATVRQDQASLQLGAQPSHIVWFKKEVDASAIEDHHTWLNSLLLSQQQDRTELKKRALTNQVSEVKDTFQIGDAFQGYAGYFDKSIALQIKSHPDVAGIESDDMACGLMSIGRQDPSPRDTCSPEIGKQAPWGLARISNRATLNFGNFNKYLYSDQGGQGVDAYVIDTGISVDHVDFEGRAYWGKNLLSDEGEEDSNGHGTHCAGTIAGKKYGVAKKAKLFAVKVARGSSGCGLVSDIVKGINFAVDRHKEQVQAAESGSRRDFKGSVINIPLGMTGSSSSVLSVAADAAVNAGVHVVVPAGNDHADACNSAPASSSLAITVSASAMDDSRGSFSNYGACVDIFAGGVSIQSTWTGSINAVNTISGTSMASAHVAGLVVYYLGLGKSTGGKLVTPQSLKNDILSVATQGALTDIPEKTSNLLAWNGAGC